MNILQRIVNSMLPHGSAEDAAINSYLQYLQFET